MRILVVGAGATGGYFGGRLLQAGRDITFLVRRGRKAQVEQTGLVLQSPRGDATLQPPCVTAEALPGLGTFDLVLLAVKAYSLDAAMRDVAPAVGADTVVMPLLNGMRHVALLQQRFGAEKIVPASVLIHGDVDAEGRITQSTDLCRFTFGESSGERTARAEALLQTLSVPGIDAVLSGNITDTLWQKWWVLASLGAACILSGGSVGEMVAVAPYGEQTLRAVVTECTEITAANGFPASAKAQEDHITLLSKPGKPTTSSMYRDMTKGSPVEADHVFGDLLAHAGTVSAPLLRAAYVRLKVYEAKREQ